MPNIEEVDAGSDIADEEETYVASTTIKKIRANKYLSLSNLKEQLGENNWADWTRRLIQGTSRLRVFQHRGFLTSPRTSKLVQK